MQLNSNRQTNKTLSGLSCAVNPEHAELISMAGQLHMYTGALFQAIKGLDDQQTTLTTAKLVTDSAREFKRLYIAAIVKGYITIDDCPHEWEVC